MFDKQKRFTGVKIYKDLVFINECESCDKRADDKCFSMYCFHFWKWKANWLWYIYCKIKLFSGAILHGTSYEPEATREATRL